MSEQARWEVWVQDYDTRSTGDWHQVASVKHRGLADAIVESGRGWGRRYEVRGGPEPVRPAWADLTLEEFRQQYAIISGQVHSLAEPWVQEWLRREEMDRARQEEARRLYEAAQDMPTRRGHPKSRLP